MTCLEQTPKPAHVGGAQLKGLLLRVNDRMFLDVGERSRHSDHLKEEAGLTISQRVRLHSPVALLFSPYKHAGVYCKHESTHPPSLPDGRTACIAQSRTSDFSHV